MRSSMKTILSHDIRQDLLARLAHAPGKSVGELARGRGIHYKTALHHVRVLQRGGLLVTHRVGRARLCYLPGARPPTPGPSPRRVAALRALAQGARTPSAVARALGIPRGTAGSLLGALLAQGLVERDAGARFRLPGERF